MAKVQKAPTGPSRVKNGVNIDYGQAFKADERRSTDDKEETSIDSEMNMEIDVSAIKTEDVHENNLKNHPGTSRSKKAAIKMDGVKNKKKHKISARTVALMEIRRFQKSTELLIPSRAFISLVKEITEELTTLNYKWSSEALEAMQEAAEGDLVKIFKLGNRLAKHDGRVTIMKKDIELARDINL